MVNNGNSIYGWNGNGSFNNKNCRYVFIMKLTNREQEIALIIAKGIVIILAIFTYALRLVFKTLYRVKKWLWRASLFTLILYSAFNAVTTITYAPYADASKNFKTDFTVKEIVLSMGRYEFGSNQVESLDNLLSHESGFNPNVVNRSSGACGLFQALPCSKVESMSLEDQIQFGFNYIKARYGTPNNAWAFWQRNNYY